MITFQVFNRMIQDAIDHQHKAVNLSNIPHTWITRMLHLLCYSSEYEGKKLYVVYADDTTPIAIPLGRLENHSLSNHERRRVAIIGTMGLRHHAMDFIVQRYLVKNSMISAKVTWREAHEIAKESAIQYLKQAKRFRLHVRLIHTGLQPVVTGIYSALEEILHEQQKELRDNLLVESVVVSRFPDDHNEQAPVYRDSFGTSLDDYETLDRKGTQVIWQ